MTLDHRVKSGVSGLLSFGLGDLRFCAATFFSIDEVVPVGGLDFLPFAGDPFTGV